eukprot:4706337-Heterocapsa_arctica.AAC.1
MVAEAQRMQGARVTWYVDNSAALDSFVKGISGHAAIDRAAHIVHFLAYKYDISIWFEFVDSQSNWSDGVSRLYFDDPFAASQGF